MSDKKPQNCCACNFIRTDLNAVIILRFDPASCACACEKRNLATVNTGFHWTVHGASQVLSLCQAPDRIHRLPPPDVWAVTPAAAAAAAPPRSPPQAWSGKSAELSSTCWRFWTPAGWKSLAMWFTLNDNQITLPGIPPARARLAHGAWKERAQMPLRNTKVETLKIKNDICVNEKEEEENGAAWSRKKAGCLCLSAH